MATNIYENEGVIENTVSPQFEHEDTNAYEVFDSNDMELTPQPPILTEPKIEFDPIVTSGYPDVFENSIIPEDLITLPDIGILSASIGTETNDVHIPTPDSTPQQTEMKFHKAILLLYELYTFQMIENLVFKMSKHQRFSLACKIFAQIILFAISFVLTVELNRELILEYRISSANQTGTIIWYQHIDVITIIISIAFSLLSLVSLGFLFAFPNILSDSSIRFQSWTLHSCKASLLPNCVLIAVYLLLFVWFIVINICKGFVNVYTFNYFGFSPFVVVVVCFIFLLQGTVLYSSPFVLCFMMRSICKQLHKETDFEIEGVKKYIQNIVTFQPNFMLSYFEQMNRMSELNHKIKFITTMLVITVFFIVSTIFLSAFNSKDGILKIGQNDGVLPQVVYLWLVFVSCYLLILTLLVIQGITALNMKVNKFSDLILIDKQVHQRLIVLEKENREFFLEIRRNLSFISSNKSRFEVAIFGDLTNSFFHSIVVFGLVLMVPFILKMPNYIQNLEL